MKKILVAVLLFAFTANVFAQSIFIKTSKKDAEVNPDPVYTLEGNAFVRHNGDRFNNRPLYCNQISGLVVTGDKPLMRFGEGSVQGGTFMLAIEHNHKAKWLTECTDITSKYSADRMEWIIKDAQSGSAVIKLEVVPPADGNGMYVRVHVENAQPGDKLIWAFGGLVGLKGGMLGDWDITTNGREKSMLVNFLPADCTGNQYMFDHDNFTIKSNIGRASASLTTGRCSAPSKIVIADADAWADPIRLLASSGKERSILCSEIDLGGKNDIYWGFTGIKVNEKAELKPVIAMFNSGMQRAQTLENRVVVETPDARLNAVVAASNAVTDAVFRDGVFTHSGMRWGVPLLGWRTTFGGIAYGWHDRLKTFAKLALAKQIKESDRTNNEPDPRYRLSSQAPNARVFGKGRVDFHQPTHYDMQSQFFDQLVYAWRATGDAELEKLLRPALELHTQYIDECFDPDGDGLYESYANTWPTDNQWYNGGGTAEETAYAYTSHRAALEMARHAGDSASAKMHEAKLAMMKKNLIKKMWVPGKDFVGSWVEQGGHERLHEDCWLYSIFCPIDAGMLTQTQAAQSLYYTEWGLQRDKMPYGGERCWASNWVPSIWSLREMWPGDNYQLALAYFQTGLGDEGWNLMKGVFPDMAFYGRVPGDLGFPNGGTDFNDCASMFCRTVVDGLFGYRPDYPNGIVKIAPQIPSDWNQAKIKTPDFSLAVAKNSYRVDLTNAAEMDLRLPVRTRKVISVIVNGKPATFELLPGFGCSIVKIRVLKTKTADVKITCEDGLPQYSAINLETKTGNSPALTALNAKVIKEGKVPATAGYHLVQSSVEVGSAPQYRLYKVKVNDTKAEAAEAAHYFDKVPEKANWKNIDMTKQFNGDIKTIFLQKYLSPRPNTASLRLATDGYSTWDLALGGPDKNPAPVIDLVNVPSLKEGTSKLRTPQGVPFAWGSDDRNIAFTSMWDNWPHQVTIPVNSKGDGIYLLLCGFTNPMQGRIANAEIRMKYTDGVVEKMPIIPPFNFWSLCRFGGGDYNYDRDWYALPKVPPAIVQLGNNCRAIQLNWKLRPGATLESLTLETFSQEVIIGLMGASVVNTR